MSISEMRIIVPRTWWMHSQMAFACGFLIVVGVCFMPYDSHNVSKCNLNSDLLLYIKYWHLGYLHNQILLTTNQLIWLDYLSKIGSLLTFSLLLTDLVVIQMTSGNSTISNQLEAGLIVVSAMKSIADPLPSSVYGPTRSTYKASQGVLITILDGRWPNFNVRLLLTWHDLHDFFMDRMITRIPFQYIAAFIVPSRRSCPGCWR